MSMHMLEGANHQQLSFGDIENLFDFNQHFRLFNVALITFLSPGNVLVA